MTNDIVNNTIDANKLRSLRQSNAWTQEELAHLCNVSTRTIQRVEKTGHISKETLKAISSAFNMRPSDFLIETMPALTAIQNKNQARGRYIGIALLLSSVSVVFGVNVYADSETKIVSDSIETSMDGKKLTYVGDVQITSAMNNIDSIVADSVWAQGTAAVYTGNVQLILAGKTLDLDDTIMTRSADNTYQVLTHSATMQVPTL